MKLINNCLTKFLITKNFPNINEEIEVLSYKFSKELILRDVKKYEKKVLKKIILNENFIKSFLLISAECVLFHHNVSEVIFYKLASKEFLNLDLFEFWKIINPFLNLVAILDNNINRHLSEIEIVLITFLVWSNSEIFKESFNNYIDSGDLKGNFMNKLTNQNNLLNYFVYF